MANPYRYPNAKHERTLTPKKYSNYRTYKRFLREEFERQCVYCRALDCLKGEESFGVDHYRPKTHFPELETEYLNLYYACNRCNSYKGTFWPSTAQRRAQKLIPNPCEHTMVQHLEYIDGTVNAASKSGDWTIGLLDLNEPKLVTFREAFVKGLKLLDENIATLKRTIRQANRTRSRATTTARTAIAREIHFLEKNLEEIEAIKRGLLGQDS